MTLGGRRHLSLTQGETFRLPEEHEVVLGLPQAMLVFRTFDTGFRALEERFRQRPELLG